jgi:hypothetical protein
MGSLLNRREFVKKLAATTGTIVALPAVISCGGATPPGDSTATDLQSDQPVEPEAQAGDSPNIPLVRPEAWDPIAYNRERGNNGAIPESYLGAINGPDGDQKHLGKHLPYVPQLDAGIVPSGYLPVMWGDPSLSYAQHPNAPKGTEAYPEGHFYDLVKVRKATEDPADEVENSFNNWPAPDEGDTGAFAIFGTGSIEDNSGKDTIYLVKLPENVSPGDLVRVLGHCRYHGEYVDFLQVPAA